VFVNVEAVYPNEQEEFSFEELRAMSRGWSGRTWGHKKTNTLQSASGNVQVLPESHHKACKNVDVENLSRELQAKAAISENSTQEISQPALEAKPKKERRLKVREVKQETQTVKTRLESPTGRGKLRRKNSVEPTMTFHSRAANVEIYDIFNKPHEKNLDDTQSGDDTDLGDDGYSTAGESTGTGRISGNTSEFDDTFASGRSGQDNLSSQPDSVSPWSDFTSSKHVPRPKHKDRQISEDLTENMDSSQNQTQTGGFDTQAIAAIANADFGDFDTKVIAAMAGDEGESEVEQEHTEESKKSVEPEVQLVEVHNKPRYVPLPPEDYEPTPLRPFRDPDQAHQNRLPFMTPIVEKTESSLGANTAFSQRDYHLTRTPSKHVLGRSNYESPPNLKLEQFLLSSPHQPVSSAKRKLG
jgi:checkpoint serine/threonine-protein kinase